MIVAVRRALAGLLVGLVAGLGVQSVVTTVAYAESPSPTTGSTATADPSSTASADPSSTASADPSAGVDGDTSVADTPDEAPDNSATLIALGGAAALALLAALVVFIRRR